MAGQQSGGFRYWLNGLPVGVTGPQAKTGTFRYWLNGIPWPTLLPAALIPPLIPPIVWPAILPSPNVPLYSSALLCNPPIRG